MEFGFQYQWDPAMLPVDAALYAEKLGFESIWFGEHTHVPVLRETPYPGGGDLPEYYRTFPDPFTCMAAVAAATKLRLGTAVLLMPLRDPIITAKQVATLDGISQGRVELGIGVGWLVEAMRNHGVEDFEHQRFKLTREGVEAMKQIWANEPAEYHGELVNFDPIYCRPKPVQRPLPVLIAGWGPRVLDRTLAFGDGWIPNYRFGTPQHLVERATDLRRRARDERGIESMPVTVVSCGLDREALRVYAEGQITRVTIAMRAAPDDPTAMDRLDRFAELVREATDAVGSPAGA